MPRSEPVLTYKMVAVADCPRCQPAKGGGWHPTRETTVLVPAGDRKHHSVRVASTDTELDVLHTMRCLKDEAARAARRRRGETHAAVMAARKAVPPPPPPPDPLLDQDAQRALRTELQQEKQRLLAAQQEFADHIERVRQSKRAAADAHEEKLKRLERELMEVKDEAIEQDRTDITAQESEMLAVIVARRRIAKEKLDARREKDRLNMGIADQKELLKLGLMVPAHLTLAASASLKELPEGFSHKRGGQKKSFVEFSTSAIEGLETSIKSAEQHSVNAIEEGKRRRLRALEQKSSRYVMIARHQRFRTYSLTPAYAASLPTAPLRQRTRLPLEPSMQSPRLPARCLRPSLGTRAETFFFTVTESRVRSRISLGVRSGLTKGSSRKRYRKLSKPCKRLSRHMAPEAPSLHRLSHRFGQQG
eukprot:COSAG02_NODE_43_length_45989_cov_93.430181_36_plen_419_part_00